MKTALAVVLVMALVGTALATNIDGLLVDDVTGRVFLADNVVEKAPTMAERREVLSELIAAAEGVMLYLDAPSDRVESLVATDLVYRPLPTALENAEKEVERLKKKDAAIKRFRDAVKKVKGGK